MKNNNQIKTTKNSLHPRNKHRERYNFKELTKTCAELKAFVSVNKFGDESIDFFNPNAVKTLNKALLKHFYGIANWDIPENYLCPPIPGRADYIHTIADLVGDTKNKKINCLDIGVGANCIYPIIGLTEYNWNFVGSDIDTNALQAAQITIDNNSVLKNKIELRLQKNKNQILNGIVKADDFFDVSICNPPFHSSAKEAEKASLRKLTNLKKELVQKAILNFGGKNNELWCEGGEQKFISTLILESKLFAKSCGWFTTLVSKESTLDMIYFELKKAGAKHCQTFDMEHGNKKSRIVAWTYFE
ncbi:MAG: 23S rRNA (adenine(1618)-N(6))-methyltransferase RlmF [Bacteroidota bacterium]